jgi:hypothetical protein
LQVRKDFWRCGIVHAGLSEIHRSGTLDGHRLTWLPDPGELRYLADPFGLWRDTRLHVFAEKFDYRDARGRIALSVYASDLTLLAQEIVLSEPWHLSYPYVFEAGSDVWMLPEAFESGASWLYRAVDFPRHWERVARIELDAIPLDATPFHDGELWWLFYAPAFPEPARLTHLHVAWASKLEGPWISSNANPILVDRHGARPAGTPYRIGNELFLPVQSCTGTYGSAIRLFRIDRLSPARIEMALHTDLTAPREAAPFVDGCHTIAGAGSITLIDVKQSRASAKGLLVRPLRRWYRQKRTRLPYAW